MRSNSGHLAPHSRGLGVALQDGHVGWSQLYSPKSAASFIIGLPHVEASLGFHGNRPCTYQFHLTS